MKFKSAVCTGAGSLFMAVLLAFGFSSCSKQAEEPGGVMDVVSVEQTEGPSSPSLIPAEAFEEWYAGAPQPSSEAIIVPSDESSLSRETEDVADGEVAIRQTWENEDDVWYPDRLFGIEVKGLEPRTEYELTLQAKVVDGSSAVVNAYAVDANDYLWPVAENWIKVDAEKGEGWHEYTGRFSTGELGTMRFVTFWNQRGKGTPPNEVLWDNWKLFRIGDAPEMEITENGLIPNGGFTAWVVGRPAPEGFRAPSATLDHSRVYPLLATDRDRDGHSVKQLWKANDQSDPGDSLFGIEVDVKPNTDYTFGIRGQDRGLPVAVAVYGIGEDGEWTAIQDPLVRFEGKNDWQTPSGVFNSGEFSKIALVTHLQDYEGEYPDWAVLDAWDLKPGEKPAN